MNINHCLVPIIYFAKEFFFEEDENDIDIVKKVENFGELTVPLMSNKQFKLHFRMTPGTFEDLLRKIHTMDELNRRRPMPGKPRTALEKELMITIWYLGNIESFRSVANRFGVTKSTCWEILTRIEKLLLRVNSHFKIISWPNRQRQEYISNGFSQNGFNGIIGCVDGSHIRIMAPKDNANSYVNRKGFHSLLIQAVCDNRMLFTDIYAGEPGSVHDYTLYRKSELYRAIQRQEILFFNDSHLIGDLAYKLSINLLVGFKDNGHLTRRQKNFNIILNKIRVKIENSFALLKGRFRKLKFLETVRLDLSCLNIMSCCILHNICILNGETFEDILNLDEIRREEMENDPGYADIDMDAIEHQSIIKRLNIVNSLPIIIRQ